jgi:hypothetical protein
MRLRHLLPALLLAAAGCDSQLATEPVDQVPVERAIVDGPTARAALIGSYDALQDLSYYGRNFLVIGDLSADNAMWTGSLQQLGQIDENRLRADNPTIAGVWGAIYAAIGRVNLVIQRVPTVPGLDDEERDQILGEAYFLRALHYHNLVKLWSDVPLVLEPYVDPRAAASATRAPASAVYAQIHSDLDEAATRITEETQTRQASLGAVWALRARVRLYEQDWQGALDATDEVLALGYELAPSFIDLFDAEGNDTPEDIFRVSFTPLEFNELGWYYLWDGRWETSPTPELDAAYEAGDVRRDLTLEEDDGDYQGIKFPTTIGGEDLHVLRLAEVLLIRAEAFARLDLLDDAVDAYNLVRERAELAPHVLGVDVTDQASVLAAIWHERQTELALEGDRWPDLVRTGRVVAVLGLDPDDAYQALYPIPASERVVAKGLSQNDGY